MAESFDDQVSRVELMSTGDPTWDLSPNDLAALKAVLADRERLRKLVERAVVGLKCVGRFHYPHDEASEPHTLDCSLAGRVSRVFGTGMTRSCELCREFGQEPDFRETDQ